MGFEARNWRQERKTEVVYGLPDPTSDQNADGENWIAEKRSREEERLSCVYKNGKWASKRAKNWRRQRETVLWFLRPSNI